MIDYDTEIEYCDTCKLVMDECECGRCEICDEKTHPDEGRICDDCADGQQIRWLRFQ